MTMMARKPLSGYVEHDYFTEWGECDTCHVRLGAGIMTEYDDTYYADDWDPDICPVPGCNGLMCLPVEDVEDEEVQS